MQMDCMIDLKNSRKRARSKVELPADSEYFYSATSLQGVLSSTTPSLPYNAAAIPVCTTVEERAPHLHLDEYGKSAIAVGDVDDIFVFDDNVNTRTENLNSLTKAIFPAHQASPSSTVYQQSFANSGDSSRIMLKSYPEESSFAQILHNRSRNLISAFIGGMSARDRIEMMNESEVEAEVEADIDSSYVRNSSLNFNSDSGDNGDRSSSGIGTSVRCISNMLEAAENHIPCFTVTPSEVFHESTPFNNDSAVIDRNSAGQSFQYQRYEDITKERKKKKSPSDSSDRMISTTGEKKPRIGPTGREIFVFDEAADQRLREAVMKYFPAIQDKDKKESLNFDNQSLESKLSISTSTSTINEFQNQSTYLSGISGGKDQRSSEEEENTVRSGRSLQKVKWAEVAAYVGSGWHGVPVLTHQCEFRWSNHLDPAKESLRTKGPWTTVDDEALLSLIEAQKTQKTFRGAYDWNSISSVIGRSAVLCQHRKTALSRNLKKKGSFSPEEDQIILQIIRNWDTDDTDDRQYVPAGSGSKNNHSPILGTFLEDAVGCCSERRSGSSSSSGRGSGDVAHYEESRQLLLSSSTKEHIDYTGNSLSSSGISNSGAQEWLGTGVGVGTGVRLGTGTGSGLGTGGRSGGILSPGNVKKNKVPRKGKWVVVGDALNRPPDCCSQRYRDTLIKRPYPLS